MKVTIRADSVEIEGYVNSVERLSKPLWSSIGYFFERVCKGAFGKALKRAKDVKILLNHDPSRELGSIQKGNLELSEDAIGLKARTTITDPEVIAKAKRGDLVGWSFGFYDREIEQGIEQGLPLRMIHDMDLEEVSLLDKSKTPAYDGTLVTVRDDDGRALQLREHGEPVETVDETEEGEPEEPLEQEESPKPEEQERNDPDPTSDESDEKIIDYSKYEKMIAEMKGDNQR